MSQSWITKCIKGCTRLGLVLPSSPPLLYGFSKIHKKNVSLRLIVSTLLDMGFILLKVLLKQNITYLEDKLSPFPQKGFFMSEVKCWFLQLYTSGVLGSASDILCALWCWFLVWSSGMMFRTPSQLWGRLYLPMFLMRFGLFTPIHVDFLIVLAKPWPSLLTFSSVVGWKAVVW